VQDILPDREAGINSIATCIGARQTVWFSAVLYTLAVIAVTNVGIYAWPVAAAGILYLINTLQFVKITDKTSATARKGWKRFL
jgi:4-hydroxybenzoate polyprenyltransferase